MRQLTFAKTNADLSGLVVEGDCGRHVFVAPAPHHWRLRGVVVGAICILGAIFGIGEICRAGEIDAAAPGEVPRDFRKPEVHERDYGEWRVSSRYRL